MRTITCWTLSARDADGPSTLVARFESRQAAEDAQSCAGGYGPEIRKETIVIYGSAIEYAPTLNTSAIASGLAKLTDEEKAALGLTKIARDRINAG